MRHFQHVKYTLEAEGNLSPSVSKLCDICSAEMESLWKKASIPIVSHTRVLKLLRTFHEEFLNLMKSYKGRKSEMKYIDKLSNIETKCREKLFDIASCS